MNHQDPSVSTSQPGLLTGNIMVRPTAGEEEDRNQKHFKTDHLLTNLRGRTISSVAVTMSAQSVKFALSLASIVMRLLTPRDFGLVAMVTTVTSSFLLVFKDAGLSIATVQREG